MRIGKAIVLLSVSAGIAVLPYLRADAVTCCDPWGVPGATAFIQAGTGVISTLTSQVTEISQFMQMNLEQTWSTGFAKAMEQLNSQTAASRNFEQGRIATSTALYMNRVRGDSIENSQEPPLLDETVTNALLLSEQFDQSRFNRRRDDANLASEMRTADPAPPDPVSRNKDFCAPRAFQAGLCEILPSSTLQNADLSFNTLVNPGDGQYETLTDDEARAGRAFVRNIVAPTAMRSVTGDSPQAQYHEALLLADQAALSLAGHSLNSVMQHRIRKRDTR